MVSFCRVEHSFSNLFEGCKMVWTKDGEVRGVRLELRFLICEFVVDCALDLAGLLQELHMELKDSRGQKHSERQHSWWM